MVHVIRVRYFEPDAGKTGKGILSFWKGPFERHGKDWFPGQHTAVDVEDVIDIYATAALDLPIR